MIGVNGKPWIDLEPFVDIESLAAQKPKIAAALAASHSMRYPSIVGAQGNLYDQSLVELGDYAKTLIADPDYEYKHLIKLLGSAPKIQLFCKYMYDVVSLNEAIHLRTARVGDYFHKHLAEHCVDTPAFQYFKFFREWLDAQNIFSEYGRVVFFVNEAGVSSIRHRDYPDGVSRKDNFIWMSLDGRKSFWIWDEEKQEQHNITSRAAVFDNADWHGSDPCKYTGWSLRVDGVFSDEFLDKTGLREHYGR
jgi:hypothetical protein